MTKKTRLTILFVCIVCFLIVAPILVAYSMGYRFDFEKMKITATGGIYIKAYPTADQVIVDSKIAQKPKLFSNDFFVQSLMPNNHTVLVTKKDHVDYFKTLPVIENQVTKLENILLIKKKIQFQLAEATAQSPFTKLDKYIIKTGNLYYSLSKENSGLTALQKSTPIIKKITAFAVQGNNIIWLKTDGLVYKSDLNNLTVEPIKLSITPIKIIKTGTYKIILDSKNIFVNNNGTLLFLNSKINDFEVFSTDLVKDAKIAGDGENIIYYNDQNIYISTLTVVPALKGTLYKSQDKITNCLWLNNDNIIFTAGDKVLISEIDYRGNVNTVTLPSTITLPTSIINIKNPEIYFDQQSGKLHILTDKTLLVSEKLVP